MYNEFKSLAVDDYSRRGFSGGLHNLIHFYSSALLSNRTIPDEVVRGLVDLINSETRNDKRPMFDGLRSAWRNGAFSLKNRRKIDRLLDLKTKAELKE
jgi:la-related protein 1